MKINLSPQRRDDELVISKLGDELTINGTKYDFSVIPDGSTLPNASIATGCDFLVGSISRVNGELELTLLLPNAANASETARFPQPIINPPDGLVELPQ